MLVQIFRGTFSTADGHVRAGGSQDKGKKNQNKTVLPPSPSPPILISKATKLRNKIKGMTVIWCH